MSIKGRSRRRRTKIRRKVAVIPRATVDLTAKRFPLKTCPEGYVELRRMSYGELLASQDLSYQVQMKASEENANEPEMGLSITRAAIAEFQLAKCVVDHNLEDDKGRKLEFTRAADVHLLDGNIGQEIDKLISDLHDWNKQFPNSEELSKNGSSTEKPSASKVGALPAGESGISQTA